MYAFETGNGHQAWHWRGGDNVFGMWLWHGTVTVLEDQVDPHGATHLAGLDAYTGHVLWEDRLGGRSVLGSPVATTDGVLAYQTSWATITALDMRTGKALWSAPATGQYADALAASGTTVIAALGAESGGS